MAHDEPEKKTFYETLTYANGPGYNTHRKEGAIADGEYLWKDPSEMTDRDDPRYRHFAPIYEKTETHGGEDVAVYAIGKIFKLVIEIILLKLHNLQVLIHICSTEFLNRATWRTQSVVQQISARVHNIVKFSPVKLILILS